VSHTLESAAGWLRTAIAPRAQALDTETDRAGPETSRDTDFFAHPEGGGSNGATPNEDDTMTTRNAMLTILPALTAATFIGCGELEAPRDVMGNFEVTYMDNLRVYIGDELVAEVVAGEDATVEWDGETFQISTLCGDEGTECPSESFWRDLAIDQPWGDGYNLLNFVNLDDERGTPGQRMGGTMAEDGSFEMLAGLAVGAQGSCAALAVATVEGAFDSEAANIDDGMLVYEWAGGCQVGEVTIGTSLRLETDFSATRVGDYDVSSVTPEEPIDEEGAEVDPELPDEEAAVDSDDTGA